LSPANSAAISADALPCWTYKKWSQALFSTWITCDNWRERGRRELLLLVKHIYKNKIPTIYIDGIFNIWWTWN
jgi:hypothetical protein